MTIRIAVIGAGLMGADHARIVTEYMPGGMLQVFCDMDHARAAKVVAAYGADVAGNPEAGVTSAMAVTNGSLRSPLDLALSKRG